MHLGERVEVRPERTDLGRLAVPQRRLRCRERLTDDVGDLDLVRLAGGDPRGPDAAEELGISLKTLYNKLNQAAELKESA